MHSTVVFFFLGNLNIHRKSSQLSKMFVRNIFCYDKSLQLRLCYSQDADTQAGLQVKLLTVGTLKK
jgi:hypothetical protein